MRKFVRCKYCGNRYEAHIDAKGNGHLMCSPRCFYKRKIKNNQYGFNTTDDIPTVEQMIVENGDGQYE